MLVNLKEIMAMAEAQNIAIGAFNCPNLESLEAILEAAESLHTPVILQFAQCHEHLIPLTFIGKIMVAAAKAASVPVCVHLDHGETIPYIQTALSLGFTSVMYDGSTLPFEENAENTAKVIALAKAYHASVEAELGSMGSAEYGTENAPSEKTEKIYTNPLLAEEFVRRTGIDALACSFGTTHGLYLSEPKLNLQIVRDVRSRTENIPVVMHGGSGVSREQYREAIRAGVRKINYFTYMDKAGGSAVGEHIRQLPAGSPLFFTTMAVAARKAMCENVKQAICMFSMKGEK